MGLPFPRVWACWWPIFPQFHTFPYQGGLLWLTNLRKFKIIGNRVVLCNFVECNKFYIRFHPSLFDVSPFHWKRIHTRQQFYKTVAFFYALYQKVFVWSKYTRNISSTCRMILVHTNMISLTYTTLFPNNSIKLIIV